MAKRRQLNSEAWVEELQNLCSCLAQALDPDQSPTRQMRSARAAKQAAAQLYRHAFDVLPRDSPDYLVICEMIDDLLPKIDKRSGVCPKFTDR